jgi:hypothetical protein
MPEAGNKLCVIARDRGQSSNHPGSPAFAMALQNSFVGWAKAAEISADERSICAAVPTRIRDLEHVGTADQALSTQPKIRAAHPTSFVAIVRSSVRGRSRRDEVSPHSCGGS